MSLKEDDKSICWRRSNSAPERSKKVFVKTDLKKNFIYDGCKVMNGFTLAEILIVIVIMSIIAMMAVPMLSSAGGLQVRSAADMIAGDMEYAKSIAIGRGRTFTVVFDEDGESYQIEDDDDDIISHPVKKGFDYIVDFSSDGRLDKVDIVEVNFDGEESIDFDYLGNPLNSSGDDLTSGVIILEADGKTITITVEAVTGYISVVD